MIYLTPSKISLANECERCFFLNEKKINERPRGIFAGILSSLDSAVKAHYDKYRKHGMLPPEIEGQVYGKLFASQEKMDMYRNWRSFPVYKRNEHISLRGAIDELIQVDDVRCAVMDYKTTSKKQDQEYADKYYKTQLQMYHFMLRKAGLPVTDYAYIAFYYPSGDLEGSLGLALPFRCVVQKVNIDFDEAEALVDKADRILRGPRPDFNPRCDYCNYLKKEVEE